MITFDGVNYDTSDPIDISIPLRFNEPQPNAFGVPLASSVACEFGALVGDTRRGGSCNFELVTLIPHCNGTHTECVGHITNDRIAITDVLRDVFVGSIVISIEPETSTTSEAYSTAPQQGDRLITARLLENALAKFDTADSRALIVRTLPNADDKLTAQYGEILSPYFTTDAMELIVARGFDHLIVDVPSIDRLHDEGRLSNHRVFWNIAPGEFVATARTRRNATITELAYVPEHVADGLYLLNLQIAPFAADASPSRPVLFRPIEN